MSIDRIHIRRTLCVINVLYIQKQCNSLTSEVLDINVIHSNPTARIKMACNKYCTLRVCILQQINILNINKSEDNILLSKSDLILTRLDNCRSILLSILGNLLVLHPTKDTFREVGILQRELDY